jgi:hypothetical protein
MHVRMISFGTNWWAAHSNDVNDPFRFSRNAAWFNSAGLKYGNRIRFCWALHGQIRFNQSSGFNPEFRMRSAGKTFRCDEPREHGGRIHLLVTKPAGDRTPDAYLVTLTDAQHGSINFDDPGWRSPGVRPISVSLRPPRYEALILMGLDHSIRTSLGEWQIAPDERSLVTARAPGTETRWDVSRDL